MIANETTLHISDQSTQKLTAIGHCTTFNNEESPYNFAEIGINGP